MTIQLLAHCLWYYFNRLQYYCLVEHSIRTQFEPTCISTAYIPFYKTGPNQTNECSPPTTNTCLFARTRCVYVCARINLQYIETTIMGYMQAAALRAIMISFVKAETLLNIQRPTLTLCRLYICNNNLLVLQVLYVITEFILLLKEARTLLYL